MDGRSVGLNCMHHKPTRIIAPHNFRGVDADLTGCRATKLIQVVIQPLGKILAATVVCAIIDLFPCSDRPSQGPPFHNYTH